MIGYLKFKDILFIYENDDFILKIQIDYFKIYLVWLRIRFYIRNLNIDFEVISKRLNTLPEILNFEKKQTFSEKEILENETSKINNIKEKLCEMIKDKYISKHYTKKDVVSDEILEDILKSTNLTKKEKFFRNLMVFFDLVLENNLIIFKISNNDFYHSIFIKKILVGAVKGINKVIFILI